MYSLFCDFFKNFWAVLVKSARYSSYHTRVSRHLPCALQFSQRCRNYLVKKSISTSVQPYFSRKSPLARLKVAQSRVRLLCHLHDHHFRLFSAISINRWFNDKSACSVSLWYFWSTSSASSNNPSSPEGIGSSSSSSISMALPPT